MPPVIFAAISFLVYIAVGYLDIIAFDRTNWPASQDKWTPPWWAYLPGGGFAARKKWGIYPAAR